MAITAIENAKSYDWRTWVLGLMRSFLSGGSSAIVASFASMGIAPDKFNFNDGLGKTAKMALVMFVATGIYRLAEFLQLHGSPDQYNGGNGGGK